MAEFTNIKINDVKYDVRDAGAARASDLAAKQDVISDLSAIRSGAAAGATAIQQADLANVATSGSYNDLTDKPTAYVTLVLTTDANNIGTFRLLDGTLLTNAEALALLRDMSVYVNIIQEDDDRVYSTVWPMYSYDEIWLFQYIAYDRAFTIEIEYVTSNNTFIVTSTQHTILNDENTGYFVPNTRKVNNKALSSDITLTASDVGAVPTTRTVNGKALSSNITLSASDVGALPNKTHIPADQVQSNWNETNTSSKAYIQNKPTIPAAQVNADWNATSGVSRILNKPTIPTVPTNVSSFTNDAGYLTQHQSLANYYTKSEIDTKIGNIETLLASI